MTYDIQEIYRFFSNSKYSDAVNGFVMIVKLLNFDIRFYDKMRKDKITISLNCFIERYIIDIMNIDDKNYKIIITLMSDPTNPKAYQLTEELEYLYELL